jgi:hypothetical protein
MSSFNNAFNRIYSMNLSEIKKRFTFLGEGISRSVYAINNDYVIKIAKGREGLYQNRVEKYVFTHASKTLKAYLCPILWYKPGMIVMPRAIPLSQITNSEFVDLKSIRSEPNAYKDLLYLSKKFYLFFEDIESTSSWGLINNIPVLIDYGCTSEEGDWFYQ